MTMIPAKSEVFSIVHATPLKVRSVMLRLGGVLSHPRTQRSFHISKLLFNTSRRLPRLSYTRCTSRLTRKKTTVTVRLVKRVPQQRPSSRSGASDE